MKNKKETASEIGNQKQQYQLDSFCPMSIRKQASAIIGTDNIDIILEAPGKVKIIINCCQNNKKIKMFKKAIKEVTPVGAIATICKR